MDKKWTGPVIAILAIVVVVVGVWAFKQWQTAQPAKATNTPASSASAANSNSSSSQLPASLAAELAKFTDTAIDVEALVAQNLPFIIDFGADGWPSCAEMLPGLVKFQKDFEGKITVRFADVWKNSKAANGFPLSTIPAQFIYNADGSPFVPGEAFKAGSFELIKDKDGKHIQTKHAGPLSYEEFAAVAQAMGVK